jgi:tetratricopeptide (TPR) repeat protein
LKAAAAWRLALDRSAGLLTALGYSRTSDDFQILQGSVELSFSQAIFLRAGYGAPLQDNAGGGIDGLLLGAGLGLSDLRLDYAYLPGGTLGATHLFSLTYSFTVPLPPLVAPAPVSAVKTNSLSLKFSIPSDSLSQAVSFQAQGQFTQAAAFYQKALAEDPENWQGWLALGRLNLSLRLPRNAKACFEKVLELNPGNQEAQKGLGDCQGIKP